MLRLGEVQLDVLKEVGNIGAGNAATALSKLISKEIDMLVPQVKIVGLDEVADFVGGAETVVVGVYLRITGDVPGNMFFVMNIESAKGLVKQMMSVDLVKDSFSDMELSALGEIGNILIGSYLSSLADFTNLNMQPTVPALAIDMAGAILSVGLIQMGKLGDFALAIDTVFMEDKEQVQGHFFFLPDPDSLKKVFSALGVPVDEHN